ncbi:hypothetical protein, partial [Salmonella enterica]|uniref:hypothetical protein n=1 Tax=Salmonella enterica TaxID=28901 RepID=UPI00398C621B
DGRGVRGVVLSGVAGALAGQGRVRVRAGGAGAGERLAVVGRGMGAKERSQRGIVECKGNEQQQSPGGSEMLRCRRMDADVRQRS